VQLYQFALVILASAATSLFAIEVRVWLTMWSMQRHMRKHAGEVLSRLEARAAEREDFWGRMAERAKEDAAIDVGATPVWPADAVVRMRQALDAVTPAPTPKEEA